MAKERAPARPDVEARKLTASLAGRLSALTEVTIDAGLAVDARDAPALLALGVFTREEP